MGLSSALPLSSSVGPAAPVSSVANGVASLVATARPEQKPSSGLQDLQLIPALRDLLKPTLDNLGFVIDKATAKPTHGFRSHLYTALVKGSQVRKVLHIPSGILDTYSDENYDALSALAYAFTDQTLFIFSEKVVAPQLRINQLMFGAWLKSMQIKVNFVSWRHIEDLASMSDEEKGLSIKEMLKLDAEDEPKGQKVLKLDSNQKALLINALTAAFQVETELDQLAINLNTTLANLAGANENLPTKILKLITWIESHDRFEELIIKACELNNTNKELTDLRKNLLG